MPTPLFGLELPSLTTLSAPEFVDAQGCQRWLMSTQSLPDRQLQSLLLHQLNLLNRYLLSAELRLQLLELLRPKIHALRISCAPRYCARPLPLAPPEQAAYDTSQALWQALETGYLHCLRSFIDNAVEASLETRRQVTTAAERIFSCTFASQLDAALAGMQVAQGDWHHLHRAYRTLERMHLTQLPVDDPLHQPSRLTISQIYIEHLLFAAAYPLELSPWQIAQCAHWIALWSARVSMAPQPPDDLRTPPLAVDLGSDEPGYFGQRPVPTHNLRWCDLSGLRIVCKQLLTALERQTETPDLCLLDNVDQDAGAALLRHVYPQWCRGGRQRPVVSAGRSCQMVLGLEKLHALHPDFACENSVVGLWQELDSNLQERLLKRPLDAQRLERGQLVGVRNNAQDAFQLGQVCWLAVDRSRSHLLAGICLFAGQSVAVRLNAVSADSHSVAGFLLPALPALKLPASLIMPAALFHQLPARAELEIIETTEAQRPSAQSVHFVQLDTCLASGLDFAHCSYTRLNRE